VSWDNRTPHLVAAGIVVCDRERNTKARPRSKADRFRDAFVGAVGFDLRWP
jgi:hypothetical protein